MRRFALGLVVAALAAAPLPSHAFSIHKDCSGEAPLGTMSGSCTATFVAPVHTLNIRAVPDVGFSGTLEIIVQQGSSGTSIKTVWATGRIQIAGDGPKTIALQPYQAATLTARAGHAFNACLAPAICPQFRRAYGKFTGQVDV